MKPKFRWQTGAAPAPIPHGSIMDTAAKVAQCVRDRGLRRSWRPNPLTAAEVTRRRPCIECGAEVGHNGKFAVCLVCHDRLGSLISRP